MEGAAIVVTLALPYFLAREKGEKENKREREKSDQGRNCVVLLSSHVTQGALVDQRMAAIVVAVHCGMEEEVFVTMAIIVGRTRVRWEG